MITISHAHGAGDIEVVRRLFRDYWSALNVDICFQNFGAELENLPGKYAPPTGALLLARNEAAEPIGCVALRATEKEGCCEMKRLYLAPEGRGNGIGRALVKAIMDEARKIGYGEMRLDTLPILEPAIALYKSEGFAECAPFGEPDKVKVLYFSRKL
jgi:GNAT superfamily N-acetyltransferase